MCRTGPKGGGHYYFPWHCGQLRMLDIKGNMKGNFSNFKCEACKKKGKRKTETQEHVYKCKHLNNHKRNTVKYNKIFGNNIQKIKQVIQKMNKNLVRRKKIMKNI